MGCLLAAFHHAPYAQHDEWYAEELSHIERHTHFEIGLYLFEEFHKEAEGEDVGKAVAEEKTSADLAGHALVEPPSDEAEHGICHRLVELSWMTRQHVDLCEDETEISACGSADDF